jgi:alkylated DNA repair dioxygenase AlkB
LILVSTATFQPLIANSPSLSVGGSRKFAWKTKDGTAKGERVLVSGDLILMRGAFQRHWLHSVPKTTKPVAPRINLTFRWIEPQV